MLLQAILLIAHSTAQQAVAPFDMKAAVMLPVYAVYSGVQITHVANDGANTLVGSHGYRLDKGYLLPREYLFRMVFPLSDRARMAKAYKANSIEASLEDNVALAMLRPVETTLDVVESRHWAVFPIDRLADPRPTDILHTRKKSRLVSATLAGKTLTATFAEDVSAQRIALVDYVFRLAPRDANGVHEAIVLKRTASDHSFAPVADIGVAISHIDMRPGDVSRDHTRIVRGRTIVSLVDGKSTKYEFGPYTGNVRLFFVGNDLYQTIPRATAKARDSKEYGDVERFFGINKLVAGRWVRISDHILEAISANGEYAAVRHMPDEIGGLERRFVTKIR
jgi:hypothetical protein